MNRIFTLFLPLLAGVSLLIGGIVVANLMLMGVNERRSEIGLRKAVGARAGDIWIQFLLESALVTVAGGVLALVVGAVVLGVSAGAWRSPASCPGRRPSWDWGLRWWWASGRGGPGPAGLGSGPCHDPQGSEGARRCT